MKSKLVFLFVIVLFTITNVRAQTVESDTNVKRYFIGSTAFVLLTPIVEPSPKYYQLNYGYRISPKDAISVEAITWEYRGPLGRPYGPGFDKESTDFPGQVRAFGMGLAYQRFLWEGIYTQIHATAFHQNYLDKNNEAV